MDDLLDRIPVVRPSPLGKLRFSRGVEAKRRLEIARAQQVPTLLLANAQRQLLASLKARWQTIAQPATSHAHDLDVSSLKTDLFGELSIHAFFGGFPHV